MKKLIRIVAALVILGVVGLLAVIFVPVQRTAPETKLAADWKPAKGQGEYLMRAGDCVACHSVEGGKELAGGRPIVTPMGTIWSTNITPDPETGIGTWSLDDFRAAMIDGVAPGGKHLLPAMPYENFRLMKEEDIAALYDYLMHDVAPVHYQAPEPTLPFPFNQRWAIRVWNWLALQHGPGFTPAGQSELQDRGQYLVEGPGHCAACHSPRNITMAQGPVKDGDKGFLSGGVLNGWNAPDLLSDKSALFNWSVDETAAYLATGRNIHDTANGEMGLVVQHSLQYLTDRDNLAIASYLKGVDGSLTEDGKLRLTTGPIDPAPAYPSGEGTVNLLTAAEADMDLGPRLYLENCSACHFVTGRGAPQIFPELVNNAMVTGEEKQPLISLILYGSSIPSTAKRPMKLVMQGYADRLSDEEVAKLATFVRSAWGNRASAISAEDVAKVRASHTEH